MGRASSSKKVARAARAGGRSTARRGVGNLGWTAAIVVVIALGVSLIVVSRNEADADDTPPQLFDHWHVAYGIDVCGTWAEPLADRHGDEVGIHTHQDGLIHIHPTSSAATGERATLGRFGAEVDLDLDEDGLEFPGQERLEDGDDCEGEPGEVVVKVWDSVADTEGRVLESDLADYAPQDGEVVAIAFLPAGTAGELQQPPTVARLQDPTAPEEGRPLVPLPGTDPVTGEVTPTSPTEDPLGTEDGGDDPTVPTAPADAGTTTSSSTP